MLSVVFTLDYEIHGSGEGSPRELMIEPTRRLMRGLERHGAKLTIMAEVAEIAQFKRYAAEHGADRFDAGAIEDQLREAVSGGHDVQLHVHPAYDRARWSGERLELEWADYDLARLGYERASALIAAGKAYLEGLLRPVAPGYACVAFRAGNWAMQPSRDIVRALRDRGIRLDTSVFKHGSRSGLVRFDYAGAFSDLVPWPVAEEDVCRADPRSSLWEVPIHCEARPLWAFLSLARFRRLLQASAHPMPEGPVAGAGAASASGAGGPAGRLAALFRRHAWKLDFNQCGSGQLVAALERAHARYGGRPDPLPVVLIGHSKLFTRHNERDLDRFLRHVAAHPDRFRFATLAELDADGLRKAFEHERAVGAVLPGA